MKKLVLLFCAIFTLVIVLIFIPKSVIGKNKNDEKFVLYNTNINTI